MIARTVTRLMLGGGGRRPTLEMSQLGLRRKYITPETLYASYLASLFICRAASHHFTPVHHQICRVKDKNSTICMPLNPSANALLARCAEAAAAKLFKPVPA